MQIEKTNKPTGRTSRGVLALLSAGLHLLASHLCVYADVLRNVSSQQLPR